MSIPLTVGAYRELIELDKALPSGIKRGAGTDPLTLPTIADTFMDTNYSVATKTAIWQGDITTLAADAIVNAANAGLRGCSIPNHPCIDWAINNAAGPEVIEDCQRIISAQGGPERTGDAKITRGYRLPAKYVLHTVGPIVHGGLSDEHETALASCYRSCLDLVAEVGDIKTVAFCAISTGVFGFPKSEAARIALTTVRDWIDTHPGAVDRVIFNVFSDADLEIYFDAVRAFR